MGGSGGGIISTPKTITTCENLKINTNLSSPVEDVLEKISIGEQLEIILSPGGVSCVAIFETKVAGAIVGAALSQLIDCLKSGNRYIAVIRSIDGAKCSVTIIHESAL